MRTAHAGRVARPPGNGASHSTQRSPNTGASSAAGAGQYTRWRSVPETRYVVPHWHVYVCSAERRKRPRMARARSRSRGSVASVPPEARSASRARAAASAAARRRPRRSGRRAALCLKSVASFMAAYPGTPPAHRGCRRTDAVGAPSGRGALQAPSGVRAWPSSRVRISCFGCARRLQRVGAPSLCARRSRRRRGTPTGRVPLLRMRVRRVRTPRSRHGCSEQSPVASKARRIADSSRWSNRARAPRRRPSRLRAL